MKSKVRRSTTCIVASRRQRTAQETPSEWSVDDGRDGVSGVATVSRKREVETHGSPCGDAAENANFRKHRGASGQADSGDQTSGCILPAGSRRNQTAGMFGSAGDRAGTLIKFTRQAKLPELWCC
jgi:hypothetical protein